MKKKQEIILQKISHKQTWMTKIMHESTYSMKSLYQAKEYKNNLKIKSERINNSQWVLIRRQG